MKKRIDSILRGKLNLDPPTLQTSVEMIHLILDADRQYTGNFTIKASDGSRIWGAAYSDNQRIIFANEEFRDCSCTITYGIDTYAMQVGSVIEGKITILSSAGEQKIDVRAEIIESEKENEKNAYTLKQFAKLAEEDFREAFLLFTSEKFAHILRGDDRKYLTLYRGFSQNLVTYQHLEEFLIATGVKEKIEIKTDKQAESSYLLNNSLKDTINITKSTWGHTRIEVSVEGSFIEVEKNVITSDDFIGKSYGLEYVLNFEKLNNRHKSGKIILKTVYGETVLCIEAYPDEDMELLEMGSYCDKRKLKLFRSFLALQLKKIDYRTWYESSKQLVEEIKTETEDYFTLFAEAYLAYCNEDIKRVIEILWPIKTGEIKTEKYWQKAVYLYLAKAAGMLPAEKTNITDELYSYYREEPENYLLLALYLNEAEKQGYVSLGGLDEIERTYEQGCRSPFLYLKAWRVLEGQEALLRKLTPFTLKVLLFAQKEGVLTKSVLYRCAFLSSNIKHFNNMLYKIMTEGYEKYPDRDLLEAICLHIMNDNPKKPAFYKWYALAIEQKIKITRLYEYYIETRPETSCEPIPMEVKLYFSYTTTLAERKKAYLYSSIVKNKEEDPISYAHYKDIAAEFARNGLKNGRINEYYAKLYNEYCSDIRDVEEAGYTWDILMAYKLTLNDERKFRSVIVAYPTLKEIFTYPITDKTAYPIIFSDNAQIFFEDGKKRRFAANVDYKLEPLMEVGELANKCMQCGIWDTKMQLYVCEQQNWNLAVENKNIVSYWRAAENTALRREYRDRIRRCILEHLDLNSDDWALAKCIDSMKELTYGFIDKNKTVDILIRFGRYDKAYNLVNKQGYEQVELTNLVKLVVERLSNPDVLKDEELLNLSVYIYKNGILVEDVLEHLCKYYEGSLEDMGDIWESAMGFNVDTFELEERYLLCSMLVMKATDRSERVFDSYCGKSGKMIIRRAYLTYLSMLYIVKNRNISKMTVERMRYVFEPEAEKMYLCAAAWLKYKTLNNFIYDEEMGLCERIISDMLEKKRIFAFFRYLPSNLLQKFTLEDKVYVEESFKAGSEVTIDYAIESEDGTELRKQEPVRECVNGLYIKEFQLFYGENVRYCFHVKCGEETYDSPEKRLAIRENEVKGASKYRMLNRMLMQSRNKESEALEATMKEYMQKEKYSQQLFEII